MSLPRRVGVLLVGLATAVALTLFAPSAAAPAAASANPIAPGVQMVVDGAQCTGNFVFRDTVRTKVAKAKKAKAKKAKTADHKTKKKTNKKAKKKTVKYKVHTRTYVGMAAHCASKGSDTDTDGCNTASYPLGTRVQFVVGMGPSSGGTQVGTGVLRYSSWLAMQKAGTRDAEACAYNDLALVQVDKQYLPRVSPTVPVFGGPTGLGAALPAAGSAIYTYGSSSLRSSSAARSGTVQTSSPWSMTVRTSPAGVPGDSGSGYLNAAGRAIGVLSTINILPDTGSNGVGSLPREVAFARGHGLPRLSLVKGGAFTPGASAGSGSGGLLGGGLIPGLL